MLKTIKASANLELDEILDLIGVSVQLTLDQFERAETSYKTVAEWLRAPESEVGDYSPDIFAQGSLRLDTTVRPLSFTEFDLDLVCLLQINHQTPPDLVYNLLLKRMRQHGTYNKIIEEMPRCIRLNYAGEFHLDIVPAIPHPGRLHGQSRIMIPDRPLKLWRDSNPKGFSVWFDLQAAKRILKEGVAKFSANANVEPLRDPVPAAFKPPLKLSVQLFKRWRDVNFMDRFHLAPSSIVLTTLAGKLYRGETHPTDALANILDGICLWANQVDQIILENPSNPGEVITDRWNKNRMAYDAFIEAVNEFRVAMHELIKSGQYPECIKELKDLFGDWPVARAFTKYAERRKEASDTGRLYTDKASGNLSVGYYTGAAGLLKNKGHTFHGE
jgi:hypothetical protein